MNSEEEVPIIFLGVAGQIRREQGFFPFNPIDIFQLSQVKNHFIYPVSVAGSHGIFLVHKRLIDLFHKKEVIEIIYRSANGKEIWTTTLASEQMSDPSAVQAVSSTPTPTANSNIPSGHVDEPASLNDRPQPVIIPMKAEASTPTFIHKTGGWGLVTIPLPTNVMVPEPSIYTVEGKWAGQKTILGEVPFLYQPKPPFTPEEISAIQANPNAVQTLRVVLGCQKCPTKLRTYTGLQRDPNSEREGFIWQEELGDSFACQCGTTTLPLKYMRESMHALLGRDAKLYTGPLNLDYIGLYAHTGIIKVVEEFNRLLDKHKDEGTFQRFIEDHPVMLARFYPIKLFKKPNILGKLQADFAILDADKKLVFIELEKPSLKLFTKREGQPTAYLIHAYEQVRSWMREYAKHPNAVLEGLGLSADQVMAVKGAVIAGRNKGENREHMQRHRADPIYEGVAFLTLDDLSASLRQISLQLA